MDSRCRVLQNVTEAWATESPGLCGWEVTERDGRSCCRSVSGDMNGVWERTWDALGRTQTTQTATSRSRSQARELHPHALRSCYSFEPQALASRSRFVVAGKEEIWCFLIRRPGRVDNTREKREKDARMRECAAKAKPDARHDRRRWTADAECYKM